jgi:hypothetical protein
MGEDLIPKPVTPSLHLNDEINKDSDVEFEYDENDIYVVHINDVHYEDIDNDINDVYINAHDITAVHIVKENFDEGTHFKEIMRSIFGNYITFLDRNTFI